MAEYTNFHSSLLRFCKLFADDRNSFGDNLAVVNFDAHSEIEDLPKQDVIGVSNYQLTVEEEGHEIEAMIGVSTVEDTNNFRLADQVDRLLQQLMPESIIPVVEPGTAIQVGIMTIAAGTKAMPVSGSALRPGVFIHIRALSRRVT